MQRFWPKAIVLGHVHRVVRLGRLADGLGPVHHAQIAFADGSQYAFEELRSVDVDEDRIVIYATPGPGSPRDRLDRLRSELDLAPAEMVFVFEGWPQS